MALRAYRLEDVGDLGIPFTHPHALSDAGVVVGASFAPDKDFHAFRYDPPDIVDLTPGFSSVAFGIALGAHEWIAGRSEGPDAPWPVATLWTDGIPTSLDSEVGESAYPTVVNAAGVVIGTKKEDGGDKGFIFDIETQQISFFSVPGTNEISLNAINEAGLVVGMAWNLDAGDFSGNVGFIHQDGVTDILPPPPGHAWARPLDVNADRTVVGMLKAPNDSPLVDVGFRYQGGSFEFVHPAGAHRSSVNCISDDGTLVGVADIIEEAPRHGYDGYRFAWVRRPYEATPVDLNTQLATPWNGTLDTVVDVNTAGQIVCANWSAGRGFLLTPSPVTAPRLHAEIAAQILFGVTDDSGGVIVVGGKPVPVPPWDAMRGLRFDQRAVLSRMSVDELAGYLETGVAPTGLDVAPLTILREQVHELEARWR